MAHCILKMALLLVLPQQKHGFSWELTFLLTGRMEEVWPCSLCVSLIAASIPFVLSSACVSVKSCILHWVHSLHKLHTSLSLRASSSKLPKAQRVAKHRSSVRNSEIVSFGPWDWRWKWKCSAITIRLGSKCFLSLALNDAKLLSVSFAGATRLLRIV